MKYFSVVLALLILLVAAAKAGSEKDYIWSGWRMTDTDYAIAHSLPNDPTHSDFYLICHGGRDQVDLAIRSLQSGGYGLETETDLLTTFILGADRFSIKAALRGSSEMLGGIVVQYFFKRDDPLLAVIADGDRFRVALPKVTSQLFEPKAAKQFFEEMATHCKR